MEEQIPHHLRTQGYRLTPQRLMILQIVQDAGGHLSPVEIFERARAKLPGITEPTVYRTLAFLREQGILMAAHTGSGSLVYETADHLHHHLVCRQCGGSVELEHDTLADLYARLNAQTGFALDDRHVTLFGLCPSCQ